MPGSGKTTLGKQLARLKAMDFVDLDIYIEQKANTSIQDIFNTLGEDAFRLLEKQAVLDSTKWTNTVVATGGGAPCFFDNMDQLNAHGLTIFIDVSTQELTRRVLGKGQNKRPLLANFKEDELYKGIFEKMNARLRFYTMADICIKDNAATVEDILNKI